MRTALSLFLVLLGVVCRVAPHPWNFAPVGAIALFAGATFDNRLAALFVPLISMFAGDVLLEVLTGHGFHALMPLIYAAYALIAVLGMIIRERRHSVVAVGAGATLGATIFFVLSNLGVWLLGSTYAPTFEGLVACYVAAIPYFGRTLASDLLYSGLLFGMFVWAERRIPAFARPEARA